MPTPARLIVGKDITAQGMLDPASSGIRSETCVLGLLAGEVPVLVLGLKMGYDDGHGYAWPSTVWYICRPRSGTE